MWRIALPYEAYGYATRSCQEDVKLGRSSGWNPIRAERSRYCIYAFVNKTSVDQVSKRPDLHGNTCDLHGKHTFAISSLRQVDEYARSEVTMSVDLQPGELRGYWRQQNPVLCLSPQIMKLLGRYRGLARSQSIDGQRMDLLPGESRGYWKHHSPGKWFRQAKITGKIHNEKAILLLDTGAEVSIVDTAFARKVGCYIDSSQIQDCVGIGDNVYRTEGRIRIKVTRWITGILLRYLAGIRLDLAHGSISLPDEVRIQLSGSRQLYSDKAKIVNVGRYLRIQAGESVELPLRLKSSIHDKLWVKDRWVPTISDGPGRPKYISIANIGFKIRAHSSATKR
ncbi:hypothetical protein PHMEG_00036330 [Phytophthora megakarya]|uniref:Peptidase A2 domain-containing protein n=1 Tax=Phytophthora megakarya TaxID=4795 RepID=A0A225ULT0_9STRA|nr:hypothetical protein PHMEG_00036330 [Phytophthora megakarya]